MNLAAICHKTCTLRFSEVLPKSTANWIRTSYPLIISQMLYHMSYSDCSVHLVFGFYLLALVLWRVARHFGQLSWPRQGL